MKRGMKIVAAITALFMMACALVSNPLNVTEVPAPTTPPSPVETIFPTPRETARIAFSATGWSVKGAGEEIFVMNLDGTGITSITNSRGDDREPAWSPDGSQIVFSSERDGNWEIYMMNADGSDQTRLTDSPGIDLYPAWSPDGNRIVFTSKRDGNNEIYVMKADGNDPTRLTFNQAQDDYPDWSPDGESITCSSFGGGHAGIYIMTADGKDYRLLAGGPLHNPKWSRDGRYIAFDGEPGGCKFEVYVMKADGTEMRALSQHPAGCGAYNKHPSWSPDGQQIVYSSSKQEGNTVGTVIKIININGSGETALTKIGMPDLYHSPSYPDWSPAP